MKHQEVEQSQEINVTPWSGVGESVTEYGHIGAVIAAQDTGRLLSQRLRHKEGESFHLLRWP